MNTLLNTSDHAHLRYFPIDNQVFAAAYPTPTLLFDDLDALAKRNVPIVLPAQPETLPEAWLWACQHQDPLDNYLPLLSRYYPFALTTTVGIGAGGHAQDYSLLSADLDAPHWNKFSIPQASFNFFPQHQDSPNAWLKNAGYLLFTEQGEPTSFVRDIVSKLQEQEAEKQHTLELIRLLKQAGSLTEVQIAYGTHYRQVHRINPEKLEEKLEKIDESRSTAAYQLAITIHVSSDEFIASNQQSTMNDTVV